VTTETTATNAPERRQAISDAALEVLGRKGSRGLTHRAVDQAAGLPPGSTSNYFRTRSALLSAALRRHIELDLPPDAELAEVPDLSLTKEQAKEIALAGLDHILQPDRRALLAARYELVLESTRRRALHEGFEQARERFITLVEALLRATGCSTPRRHAVQLVTAIDGILLDQLLATAAALDRRGIEEAIGRQLESC
jgi:DNA-binding transcriptional regulator YbjK